jgi:hypothetical protein
MKWLEDPSEINGDNLNKVRLEASRYFRNKKWEYLKDKIKELATNSKNKNIRDLYRGINYFKGCYQPRNNLVNDENGALPGDSHIFQIGGRTTFLLLNEHEVSHVRQIEVHTAELLVPGQSRLEPEFVIAKSKKYKSPRSDQIPAELTQAGGETLLSAIHKHISSIWNKEEFHDQWTASVV